VITSWRGQWLFLRKEQYGYVPFFIEPSRINEMKKIRMPSIYEVKVIQQYITESEAHFLLPYQSESLRQLFVPALSPIFEPLYLSSISHLLATTSYQQVLNLLQNKQMKIGEDDVLYVEFPHQLLLPLPKLSQSIFLSLINQKQSINRLAFNLIALSKTFPSSNQYDLAIHQ
jgi:hypothetical protein